MHNICCDVNTDVYCKACDTRLCKYHLDNFHYIHMLKVPEGYVRGMYFFCPKVQRLVNSVNGRWPGDSQIIVLDVSTTDCGREPELWEWLKPKETSPAC